MLGGGGGLLPTKWQMRSFAARSRMEEAEVILAQGAEQQVCGRGPQPLHAPFFAFGFGSPSLSGLQYRLSRSCVHASTVRADELNSAVPRSSCLCRLLLRSHVYKMLLRDRDPCAEIRTPYERIWRSSGAAGGGFLPKQKPAASLGNPSLQSLESLSASLLVMPVVFQSLMATPRIELVQCQDDDEEEELDVKKVRCGLCVASRVYSILTCQAQAGRKDALRQ